MEKKEITQEKSSKRGAPKKIKILNKEELSRIVKREKEQKIKTKLSVLNLIAICNVSPREASKIWGIAYRPIYLWIADWNKKGYKGLKEKLPSKGKPPKLDKEDLKKLKEYLKEKPFWTTKEVRVLIKERFSIELSENQIRRILREKLVMNFSKPYPKDYRRPKDAEEILAGNLKTVMRLLKEKGVKEEEIAIGFLDESSPQLTANTQRVWSFGKCEIEKNTNKMKSNTIGFYAIRGKDTSDFLETSKAEDITKFLEKIKVENKEYKAIVVVLDNFSSHKSKMIRDKAEKLGIYFVYLPPYSPNLNPIEFLWKSIKRVISLKLIKNINELKSTIKENFEEFAVGINYAKGWIKKFMIGYNLCEDLWN